MRVRVGRGLGEALGGQGRSEDALPGLKEGS